nr:MAG TPA: hypothetical protein [Crassvirales sp.]
MEECIYIRRLLYIQLMELLETVAEINTSL